MVPKIRESHRAVFSEEYGGNLLRRFLCFGMHYWQRLYSASKVENFQGIDYHTKITIYKCKDCGRRWILVETWKEWLG